MAKDAMTEICGNATPHGRVTCALVPCELPVMRRGFTHR